MEAELVKELPAGDGWQFEPKWDGFRGILENDGGELALWSRKARPLLRYFPELRPLGDLLPPHSALDGEIVIARDGVLDFDSMQLRLHPAESRIRKLPAEIPADFVVFDVLLWVGAALHERSLEERRPQLCAWLLDVRVEGARFRRAARLLRVREGKAPHDCTWREVRPPRSPDDPTFEGLLAAAGRLRSRDGGARGGAQPRDLRVALRE